MATIVGIATDKAREVWPQMIGGLITFQAASYFKIAEGGWVDPGGGKQPRDPAAHAAENDVDAIANPGRYGATDDYVFQKSFVGGDLSFVAPTTLRCRCFLDFGDANDDGHGNNPEFWEIAVFDANNNMLAYGTFPQQTKNNAVQITNYVNIIF